MRNSSRVFFDKGIKLGKLCRGMCFVFSVIRVKICSKNRAPKTSNVISNMILHRQVANVIYQYYKHINKSLYALSVLESSLDFHVFDGKFRLFKRFSITSFES